MNSGSTVSTKSAIPVAAARPAVKVKLPSGVLPILDIIDPNVDADSKLEDTVKREEAVKSSGVKTGIGNEDMKIPGGNNGNPQDDGQEMAVRRHIGEQILHRLDNADWLRDKGVQEIGDFGNEKLPE